MFILRRFSRLGRPVQFAIVAIAAFAIGSGTITAAAQAGIPVGSLFYIPVLNDVATPPCSTYTSPAGKKTTTCNAVVDANGRLAVSDADTHKALGQMQYDSSGNLKVTGQGSSTVTGHVNVDNLPSTQTVHVDNVPATQNVNIVGGSAAAALPVATRAVPLGGHLNGGGTVVRPVNMKVTYMTITGCDLYRFSLSGGSNDSFEVTSQGITTFPIPMDITLVEVYDLNPFIGCDFKAQLIGY